MGVTAVTCRDFHEVWPVGKEGGRVAPHTSFAKGVMESAWAGACVGMGSCFGPPGEMKNPEEHVEDTSQIMNSITWDGRCGPFGVSSCCFPGTQA